MKENGYMELVVNNVGLGFVIINVSQSVMELIAGLPMSNISIFITLIFSVGFLLWKTTKMRAEAKIKKLEYIQKLDECRKSGIDTSSVE